MIEFINAESKFLEEWHPKEKQIMRDIEKFFYRWKKKRIRVKFDKRNFSCSLEDRYEISIKSRTKNNNYPFILLIHELIHVNRDKIGPTNDLLHTIYICVAEEINKKYFSKIRMIKNEKEKKYIGLIGKEIIKYFKNSKNFDIFYDGLLQKTLPSIQFVINKDLIKREYYDFKNKNNVFEEEWRKIKKALNIRKNGFINKWKRYEKQVLFDIAKLFYPWSREKIKVYFYWYTREAPYIDPKSKEIHMLSNFKDKPYKIDTLIHELIHFNVIPHAPHLLHIIYCIATVYIHNKYFDEIKLRLGNYGDKERKLLPLIKREFLRYSKMDIDFERFYKELEYKCYH